MNSLQKQSQHGWPLSGKPMRADEGSIGGGLRAGGKVFFWLGIGFLSEGQRSGENFSQISLNLGKLAQILPPLR